MNAYVPEDPAAIRRAVRGDERALAELLQNNYAMLYRYMLKVTMHKAMAEDLVQETMLRAIERISTFKAKSKFSTWLISIATRLYMDEMRRQGRERKWQTAEQALQAIRFETSMQQAEWPHALDALAEMPYDVRVPILLKYYYGYAYEEIAQWLDIPLGTVKSRLHNGLSHLRKELKEDEDAANGIR
ncbi:RNA polymerase sigma factor SigY [Cohnella lubricantis]|uniref:RNA polymerase sigma factor n=1 Tax=Cohnella lubricantis TaxID=2163172 RepID=A0A841TH83_9BACL|nr:RNA polymerase sigma factor SigY [Cohnella lubricantis]MBB6679505.1 RNA polymerase sigma factor SigY [Cohnella lubricantis]MBP2118097.1 RNA polymerase sigma-70 factor (ECF subfamily) [Cohnella lubricantis]